MKNKYMSAIALVSVLALAWPAYAQRGEKRMGPRDGKPCMNEDRPCMKHGRPGEMPPPFFGDPERLKEKLGLSDEQVSKIAAINLEYKKKFMDYHEKMAPKHIRLRKMLLEDNVDLAEVRKLVKETSDIHVEVEMLRIQHHIDIEKVLTPEQRTKLRTERRGMKMDCPRAPEE
jgi:Spy/CpxP family protein refolding chaperone